jgi:hypothetical protein
MREEKYELEKAAINYFIKRYNNIFDNKIELIQMQDKPDAILKNATGELFGVEIAHLFLNEVEAKYALHRSTKNNGMINFQGYVKPLNEILLNKSTKIPKFNVPYPVDLLIRSASPLLTAKTIEGYKKELVVPNRGMRNIWLLLDNDKYSERWVDIVRL